MVSKTQRWNRRQNKSVENTSLLGGLLTDSDTGGNTLLGLISSFASVVESKKIKRSLFGAMAVTHVARHYAAVKQARKYTITVTNQDELYHEIHAWALRQLASDEQRALVAHTVHHGGRHRFAEELAGADPKAELFLLYDGTRSHVVNLDGHAITITVNKGENATTTDEKKSSFEKAELVFTMSTPEARDAVVALLRRLMEEKYRVDRKPGFLVANQWNEFYRSVDVPERKLNTVVLKTGQLELLVDDLQEFFDKEQRYVDLGIPYHRGYLFHGPPGGGKTSVAKALANHFKLDVYYIALGDLKEDGNLMSMLSSIRPKSVFLLEDVDVLHAATSRTENPFGVSLSGLLNSLDGFGTPHGLITILTTNHIEVLDPALVRPGRVDLVEEFSYLDNNQLTRLFSNFYGLNRDFGMTNERFTPAQIVEVFKRNMDDAGQAEIEIKTLLAS